MDKLTAGAINEFAREYYASLVVGDLLGSHQIITAYTLNNPNVMRLEPPLVVTKEEIDYVLNSIDDIFSQRKGLLEMAVSVVTKRSPVDFRRYIKCILAEPKGISDSPTLKGPASLWQSRCGGGFGMKATIYIDGGFGVIQPGFVRCRSTC